MNINIVKDHKDVRHVLHCANILEWTMMNKIDCEDLNRWQTVKRGRYGAAPIKILQGKNPPQTNNYKNTTYITNKYSLLIRHVPARICFVIKPYYIIQ